MEKSESLEPGLEGVEAGRKIPIDSENDNDGVATRISKRTYAAFAAICTMTLAESLDATSIPVVLPVSFDSRSTEP
jgi:hypothetical protein